MNRVDRLMGYLLLFQSRGLLRDRDFAARFEISERTVYRDIQALCEVGVPIVALPGEGYRLIEGYYLPPIVFSEGEARALFLAISMLTGLANAGPTRQAAEQALEKIRVVLPRGTLAQVEALQAVLGFYAVGRPPLQLDDDTFVRLQQAIQRCQVVHLRYHALHDNSVTERDVEPLQLAYLDNTWILGAYCRLRQDQRNFRLDRIDALTITAETFVPRELVRQRLPASGTRVVVRFDPTVVRWVREAQHYTFVDARDDDRGGAVMVYQVAAAQQIVGWLLTWGSQMEVLEPLELRGAIAETAARMQERHRDEPSEGTF
jgi:predicted DNA-binding transcriptional regulator YafY